MNCLRIALLGPESTGKSVLAEQLAKHYGSIWVREFARDYLSGLGRPYDIQDVHECRQGQCRLEEEALEKNIGPIFFDTDCTINFDIWLEVRYGLMPERNNVSPARYDFYLLTFPDLPFQPDPLRENPHKRDYLFERYKEAVGASHIPYEIITGSGPQRIRNAIAAVDRWIERTNCD